jgi:hypothetical protein
MFTTFAFVAMVAFVLLAFIAEGLWALLQRP